MTNGTDPAITRVLEAVGEGDPGATEALLPLVYDALRRLARSKMSGTPAQTLQPTALVHEAYLRVVGSDDPGWKNRGHFFGAAAQAMRRILVEQARNRARRGRIVGQRVPADEVELPIEAPSEDVLRVDEVLERLEAADPFNRQLVNLRYFTGLNTRETAAILGVSVWAVERQWRFIQAWLRRELSKSKSE
jgi:RNA polymerase sigma factor (TIGR02999 family)